MASGNESNWRKPNVVRTGTNGRSRKPEEKINLVVELKNPTDVKSQAVGASVFVTVDTSVSMAGSKLKQVVESMKQVIDKAPGDARFTIRAFADDVKVLVTKKKSRLDVNRVTEGIHEAKLGVCTALYDAIGATIKEIPYKAYKTDRIYILVFTDGEENVSKKETLESVMEQIRDVVSKEKVIFTFIQAGTESKIVEELSQLALTNPGKCNILKVEDSANGIKIAFEKAQKQMTMHLELELYGLGGLSNNLAGLKISTGPGQGGQVRQSLPKNAAVKEKSHKPRGEAAGGGIPVGIPGGISGRQEVDLIPVASKLGWQNFQGAVGPLQQDSDYRSFPRGPSVPGKIHVANIPFSFQVDGIVHLFSEWGPCKLVTNGGGIGGQWVVLSYYSKENAEKAVKEANNRSIQNQRIVVNQY